MTNPTTGISKEDWIFLKSKGISGTMFLRQAIRAYKQGKFEYDYLEGIYDNEKNKTGQDE